MKPCEKCNKVIDLHNSPICGFCQHKEKNQNFEVLENFDDFDFEKAMQEYDDELEKFDDNEDTY